MKNIGSDDRLVQLAQSVLGATESISQRLHERDLPQPSFDADAPRELPVELETARQQVLDATQELHQLLLGPAELVHSKTRGHNPASLHALSAYKLAEAVPLTGGAPYADLSHKCGLNEPDLRRIVRHLAADHILQERDGCVLHTAASRAIQDDAKLRDLLDSYFVEIFPAMCHTVAAMAKWPNSQDSSHNGFAHFTGGEQLFAYLERRPERARVFGSAMSTYSTGPGWEPEHVLQSFDWAALKSGTVVDVGGAIGTAMSILSCHHPQLSCIVQDLGNVIENHLKPSTHSEGRVQYMAHDFFAEQPVKGADVYFFRMVFHDWSDHDSVRILRALIPALKPGAHIVLNEWCMPEPNTVSRVEEQRLRTMDMNMLSIFNSCERDRHDWATLFRQADPRFSVEAISRPTGSNLSAIRVLWEAKQ